MAILFAQNNLLIVCVPEYLYTWKSCGFKLKACQGRYKKGVCVCEFSPAHQKQQITRGLLIICLVCGFFIIKLTDIKVDVLGYKVSRGEF